MITHLSDLGHVNGNRVDLFRLGAESRRAAGVSVPGRTVRDMTTGEGITLGSVNVEADDPGALANFWAHLLGSAVAGEHQGHVFLSP